MKNHWVVVSVLQASHMMCKIEHCAEAFHHNLCNIVLVVERSVRKWVEERPVEVGTDPLKEILRRPWSHTQYRTWIVGVKLIHIQNSLYPDLVETSLGSQPHSYPVLCVDTTASTVM
eukprot:TRINITY_DN4062_c0_g4_i2.p1 TRINITY_DN4062_c0_g4~~TRINITY_DN4062_c0_g4_i2.p1  ORF type:complete len:117 (+),score=17.81 TRINITY_DN4062_c0_g4_i2:44-394(+)